MFHIFVFANGGTSARTSSPSSMSRCSSHQPNVTRYMGLGWQRKPIPARVTKGENARSRPRHHEPHAGSKPNVTSIEKIRGRGGGACLRL
jgi:hypothetical protein